MERGTLGDSTWTIWVTWNLFCEINFHFVSASIISLFLHAEKRTPHTPHSVSQKWITPRSAGPWGILVGPFGGHENYFVKQISPISISHMQHFCKTGIHLGVWDHLVFMKPILSDKFPWYLHVTCSISLFLHAKKMAPQAAHRLPIPRWVVAELIQHESNEFRILF